MTTVQLRQSEGPSSTSDEVPDVERQHLPGLDGIRAVAVAGVLLFHGGAGWFGGGLLGVDIFFVLSGFLITSLLVGEWSRTGTLRFGRFYARRARRLVPGLVILLLIVAAYARWFAPGGTLGTIRGDALSTMAYVANWRFILSGQSYFVHYGPPSPLLHTWSLAVEEQFYLVWPAVAWVTLRHFGRRALAVVAVVGIVASAIATAVLFDRGVGATSLYYGTGTRVQEVMAGALLAIVLPDLARRVGSLEGGRRKAASLSVALLGCAGAVFLVWALHAVAGDGGFLYRGGFILVAAASVSVILVVALRPLDPIGRFLALGGLAYIGRISYGLYLYHYPLFLVLDPARTGLEGWELLALRLGVTLVVAVASYHLVELPVRRRASGLVGTHPWRWAAGAVAGIVALVALLVVSTIAPPSLPTEAVVREKPALFAVPKAPPPGLVGFHAVRVLVLGDSIADTLGQGLEQDAGRWGAKVFDMGFIGCDLDPDSTVNNEGFIGPPPQGCKGWQQTWPKDVALFQADVVAIELGRWEVLDRVVDGHWTTIGQKPWDDLFTAELTRAIKEVSATGAKVVLFTTPFVDPPNLAPNGQPWDSNLPSSVAAYNHLLRRIAKKFPRTVSVIDLNRLLDPGGHYTSTLDSIVVRTPDDEHLTPAGGELLRPEVLPQLVDMGRQHEARRTAELAR